MAQQRLQHADRRLPPEFAGNKPDGIVSTCQDCHMRDVTGNGCNLAGRPGARRPAAARHDRRQHLVARACCPPSYPGQGRRRPPSRPASAAPATCSRTPPTLDGRCRRRQARRHGDQPDRPQAADRLSRGPPDLAQREVLRRRHDTLLGESGAYDPATGVLSHDPEAKIYEVHPGIGDNIAAVVGLPAGPSLHFVLNNKIFKDNRIPPRGLHQRGLRRLRRRAGRPHLRRRPVLGRHALHHPRRRHARRGDASTTRAPARSSSSSCATRTRTNTKGQEMYDLWNDNGKCPPELMAETAWTAPALTFAGIAERHSRRRVGHPGLVGRHQQQSAGDLQHLPQHHQRRSGLRHPVLTTQDLSAVVSPLDPGSTSQLTHYFVVRATDDAGGSETNTVEIAVQPLLDPAKDQDGDGMTNGLESQYGFNPFDPADATADSDGDGFTSLQESVAGTSPISSADLPRIESVTRDGNDFHVRFPTIKRPAIPSPVARVVDETGTWNDIGGPGERRRHREGSCRHRAGRHNRAVLSGCHHEPVMLSTAHERC